LHREGAHLPSADAEPAELKQTLAHALQFNGRKAFRPRGVILAGITAAHRRPEVCFAPIPVITGRWGLAWKRTFKMPSNPGLIISKGSG